MKARYLLLLALCMASVTGCIHAKRSTDTIPATRDMLVKVQGCDEFTDEAIGKAMDASKRQTLEKGAKVLYIDSGYRSWYGAPHVLKRALAKEFALVPQDNDVVNEVQGRRIRYLAATAGCDYIMFVEQIADSDEKPLPTKYFSWIPIVGWFFIPDRVIEYDQQVSVMVVDTRTGASFIEASPPIEKRALCVLGTAGFQEATMRWNTAREASQALLEKLHARMDTAGKVNP